MGQIQLIGSFFMIAIFAIAIISYTSNFADENDVAIDIADDIRVTDSILESEIDSVRLQTNSSGQAFSDSTIESGDETSTTGGVFKALSGTFTSVGKILTMGKNVIFGDEQGISGPGIALTALGTFMATLIILYTWKTWAGKSPD
jgi:hypothetical protein